MLFEVFRCEETDTINNIAIAHFLKVWFVQATSSLPIKTLHFIGILINFETLAEKMPFLSLRRHRTRPWPNKKAAQKTEDLL